MEDTPSKIILATTNKGKIKELAAPMKTLGIQVIGLDGLDNIPDIKEDGKTFAQNALIKARTVTQATGCITIADDSGLEVDALNGRPGVHSARYSDDWVFLPNETKDQRNMRKLLWEMEGVPENKRTCRFVTCIAAVRPDGREITIEGQWEGRLLMSPLGENGFGYDPIFFDPEIGTSAAMLSTEQKTARSHRGKAIRGLLERWKRFLSLPSLATQD
ncbi:MAG: RdgB/HAM1 family non-canonical purine NTP pyrophosphatase [Desulfovibrio sp.]|nr:RdgB/HAM1 family non-canonical purine NTP pyrophosphatase [Desulfovibrio sp.]